MTVTIDPRYYDAVIIDLDRVVRDMGHPDSAINSTVALVHQLHDSGLRASVYASSRTVEQALAAAGIDDVFPIFADGNSGRQPDRSGSPGSTALLEAAMRLGVCPNRCVVIEASEAGTRAARESGFALVVGVDRLEHADKLRRNGADTVVAEVADITVHFGQRRMSALPDALQSYGQISAVLATRQLAVLLDFDGTLSVIVDDPDTATLVEGAADVLKALAAHCNVAVLSGRDLADIIPRVGLPNIWYAGSHGFELKAPDGTFHHNESAAFAVGALDDVATELRGQFASLDGVRVEQKKYGIAVHYRKAMPQAVREVTATVYTIGQRRGLRVTNGRKVIELQPNIAWDKGKMLQWILHRIGETDPPLPIYIGDDLTDEDAFDAVRYDGIGIVARHSEEGDRPSAARFALDGPDAVREFIAQLARQVAGQRDQSDNPWSITFGGYEPRDEPLREALCTAGNGCFATRGCVPESTASGVHYPGTYAAGIYNRLTDRVGGNTITNESLVNLPNWLPLTFRIDGGPWFDIDATELLSYLQTLDLRRAVLSREFRFRDATGRTTAVTQRRFVAMHLPHVAGLQTTVKAENWSGTIELRSSLHGDIENRQVERYRELSGKHLAVTQARELSSDSVLLGLCTVESRIPIAIASRTTLWRDGTLAQAGYRLVQDAARIGHNISVGLTAGQSVTLEKIATLVTGRDPAVSEPADDAERHLHRLGRFDQLLHGHTLTWAHLWERFNIHIGHNPDELRIVRLHLLHLLQTLSPNTAELDAGAPARGLHGEAYRGHIFWDELFVFPALNMHLPTVTRSLLQYRYRRLPQARRAAAEAGYVGAMFPWQSGSDGREESQQLHLNPRSGRWNPDPSARAHHVGIAVAYNVWQYYQVTGDVDYLVDYGAEMLTEIARFWVSLASFDSARGRYVIRGVIGPDEFHSGYPGRVYDGIDNNAYTNVMAVWVIVRAMEALELLPLWDRLDLLERLGVDGPELDVWDDVSRRMYVPFHDGVISQFEGYEQLAELDWHAYRQRYGNIQRLDRILEAENDNVNHYKASKQADALMLFYLLSSDELRELFARLGYRFTPAQIPKTIDYYRSRTSHGSTLSAIVHSWVLARGDRDRALKYFQQVLLSDVADIQGGTVFEGIHLAAMAGSVDLLQRCFTGVEFRADRIVLNPLWPEELGKLSFPLRYRGHRLYLQVSGREATISSDSEQANSIDIEYRGRVQALMPGQTIELSS
ncbi:trehalose-phosphatase [Mycobacterium noviomagense]|uniref:Putative glycosyl hydrolase n=1 Tax=Mycobacterium noviomagense TaxID=459858 RepID=A0A7I7PI88_9MYCO|nr:trehalose-phosphatase [Mycobacterium noviomagense]ORB11271.1 trehalose-phosphatase [Mycobacterium noviomagense]BBY08255.1 putative glycosyl hydrolase [Mycobacterium noviomagense]